jgi:hypothetical protein
MVGLFLSEVVLFVIAGLIGFAAGWRIFVWRDERRRRTEEQHISTLRAALSDAQVRRARAP